MEYFSKSLKKSMCAQCVFEGKIERDTLSDSRKLIQDLMQRWINLIDNATYMPCEHIQKEKEFGIRWRTAFKKGVGEIIEGDFEALQHELYVAEIEDPFVYMHRIIKKGVEEASELCLLSETLKMWEQSEKLCTMETTLYLTKAILKCRDPDDFDNVKEETLTELDQLKNPEEN